MADGRIYGIFDGTAQANLQQMIFGTQTVTLEAFQPTWAQVIATNTYGTGDAAPIVYAQTIPGGSSDQGCPLTMGFGPEITMEGSPCYATYLPTSASGPTAIGRAFGTSGIIGLVRRLDDE